MNAKPITVLLIEDDPEYTQLIHELLSIVWDAPFDLKHSSRLSTGLERLAEGPIDVVLLDLSLPDSWGFDTFARVYARAPGVPIIVLSGLSDEALAAKVVQEGAQDCLIKGQAEDGLLVRAMRYAVENTDEQD